MELRDSRRLPGANFLWRRPSALIEVNLQADEVSLVPELTKIWCAEARALMDALGWTGEQTTVLEIGIPLESRTGECAATMGFALSSPLDGMYAATSIAEFAFEAAAARLSGKPLSEGDFEEARARIGVEIAEEANPALIAMRGAALSHAVCFLSDDEELSVGMGGGSKTWPVREVPAPSSVDWNEVYNIPHVLVTGTNGKSTTVRLVSAIAHQAGFVPGICSTDWVRVGSEVVDSGDWSGPGGARLVLRDQRVTFGLLETARGGMMRRGLALEKSELCAILNISEDHLSDWGTPDLESLTDAKFIVARVSKRVVLNADDEHLVRGAKRNLDQTQEILWFSLNPQNGLVLDHLAAGGRAVVLNGNSIELRGPWPILEGSTSRVVCSVQDVPMTLGGAALYNVANALAAVAIAAESKIEPGVIAAGLQGFTNDATNNPGRLNEYNFDGVRVLVDFAHNSAGLEAFFGLGKTLDAKRRLLLIGQAGDRDEKATRDMARIAWEAGPDLLILKELTLHLRGRELGELPALLESELRALGAPEERWCHAPSEMDAIRMALDWAQPGDLLMLLVHDYRDEVLGLLAARQAASPA